MLTALGVVFGDIGTSPLYAFRECFSGHGLAVNPQNVLGVLSLVLWSLTISVSIKYLAYVLRADNHGEGGILALMTLAVPSQTPGASKKLAVRLGIIGAALLFADGMITPAISVLSAVEGLKVATATYEPYVVPISVAILVLLFLFQRYGTSRVGVVFGPIAVLWFFTLAVLGVRWIIRYPAVLLAVNPLLAVRFFAANQLEGFLVLSAVFLVVTGGEALYADLGHFGRRPVRLVWFVLVFPSLILNYFGQGALLLLQPEAVANPFYHMAPPAMLYPLLLLATAATIIASQAIISGAFSLTRQALQLGYLPRVAIRHSSAHEIGQVYVPWVNWLLMLSTIALVVGFKSSGNLAGAYGLAVALTMTITTLLAYRCAWQLWGWSRLAAGLVTAGFLIVDIAFLAANSTKIPEGGWIPLLVALVGYSLMRTWKQGRTFLAEQLLTARISEDDFLRSLEHQRLLRVPGTAVFMDGSREGVPRTLLHNIKHNKVLHERVILMTIARQDRPRIEPQQRLETFELGSGLYRVIASYGFMETPNIQEVMRQLESQKLVPGIMQTTFFLGRETLILTRRPTMPRLRKYLFTFMSRNAQGATLYFRIPPNRVVEIGEQVEL